MGGTDPRTSTWPSPGAPSGSADGGYLKRDAADQGQPPLDSRRHRAHLVSVGTVHFGDELRHGLAQPLGAARLGYRAAHGSTVGHLTCCPAAGSSPGGTSSAAPWVTSYRARSKVIILCARFLKVSARAQV